MSPAQLSSLRIAEDAATAAQARLAKLHAVQREVFAAMVSAGNARATELLDPEDMKLFGFEGLSDKARDAAELGMDDLIENASSEAGSADDFLHDLECEAKDAAHSLAEAAE